MYFWPFNLIKQRYYNPDVLKKTYWLQAKKKKWI